jgi:outer membrane protein OmpA-like peptidoglycan-associated protein
MSTMKCTRSVIISVCGGVLIGCAANIPPPELINARQAYSRASAMLAAHATSAELLVARDALMLAEKSFKDNAQSFRTRDLAYIADRKAKVAEALAGSASSHAATSIANQDYNVTQTERLTNSQEYQVTAERAVAIDPLQFAREVRDGPDAKSRAFGAQADLVKLAAVKEEPRGLVITLPSSALFTANTSELFPAAQNRLKLVANALMVTKERMLTIEGHTDSKGSSSRSQQLSRRRADTVRSYFISRGYPGDRIQAQGIGNQRPVGDNASAQGRANNSRVEIIVDRTAKE